MKAKDVMTKDIIKIKPDTPALEAIDLLLQHRISGLPVVDDKMHLAGVLSEKDLLNILFETGIDVNTPVKRFMSKKVIQFKEEDSVVDICSFFMNSTIRRVPIVKDNKLVGVISRRDILKVILATVLSLKDKR